MVAIPEPPWLAAWKAQAQGAPPPSDGRRANGTFAPGAVGNPKGMAKGTKHTRTLLAAEFDAGIGDIVAVVKERALGGDMMAAKLVLDRAVPARKPVAERVQFKLSVDAPLHSQAAAVVQAVADGHLSPDDAQTVLACLNSFVQLRDADTVQERLRWLEAQLGKSQGQGGVVTVPMDQFDEVAGTQQRKLMNEQQ